MRLDARRSFAGCCYLSPILPKFARIRIHNVQPSRKANGYPFNSFSDGPNWTRAFHHILFLNPSTRKKKRKNLSAYFPGRPFFPLSFIQLPVLYSPTYPGPLYISLRFVDTREKNRGRKNVLFGRMIIVIKKLRERWWKSVSLPPWWGGDPAAATPSKFLALGPF